MTTAIAETVVEFTVVGRPQQKGSKRVFPVKGKGRMDYVVRDANPNAKPWASAVAAAAFEHYSGPLVRSAVGVELGFYFARPRSHYGTGRNAGTLKASAPAFMTTMPDVDKLARCALDALTGVIIADDSQITGLVASKGYGEPERLTVRVWLS